GFLSAAFRLVDLLHSDWVADRDRRLVAVVGVKAQLVGTGANGGRDSEGQAAACGSIGVAPAQVRAVRCPHGEQPYPIARTRADDPAPGRSYRASSGINNARAGANACILDSDRAANRDWRLVAVVGVETQLVTA